MSRCWASSRPACRARAWSTSSTSRACSGTRCSRTWGYGSQEQTVVPGTGPAFPFTGDRWRSVSTFIALNPEILHLGQRRAQGEGGTCYGDSGGPQFLGAGGEETNIVISVTTTGDSPCYATNVTTRTDTEDAREFLGQFVTLP